MQRKHCPHGKLEQLVDLLLQLGTVDTQAAIRLSVKMGELPLLMSGEASSSGKNKA